MPITRKELSQMLIKAFEELNETIDSPNTFSFKGFNQQSVDDYLEQWLELSQEKEASIKMAASYDHSNETIQVWFYYNDYHNCYYEDDAESVIGISGELSDDERESEGSGEE